MLYSDAAGAVSGLFVSKGMGRKLQRTTAEHASKIWYNLGILSKLLFENTGRALENKEVNYML